MASDFEYTRILEKAAIMPNFWVSDDFFRAAGFRDEREGRRVMILDPHYDTHIVPPLTTSGDLAELGPGEALWSDYPDGYVSSHQRYSNHPHTFLDHNFIYWPKAFTDLSGGQLKVFRKNVRKFPDRHGPTHYFTVDRKAPNAGEWAKKALDVLKAWLQDDSKSEDEDVEDAETMVRYIENPNYGHRSFLVSPSDGVLGVNIWDENFAYVNYRYSFVKPGYPFLNEYLRLMFYLNDALPTGKLVNDGGSLGKEALFAFKQKLNPLRVHEIHSWGAYFLP